MNTEQIAAEECFTGSSRQYTGHTTVRVSIPVAISIRRVDNFNAGKLMDTRYEWVAAVDGREIASTNVIYDRPSRTEAAAISKARKAIRAHFHKR